MVESSAAGTQPAVSVVEISPATWMSPMPPVSLRMLGRKHAAESVVKLPETWTETYATSDIVEYDGVPSVKVGREFLLRKR